MDARALKRDFQDYQDQIEHIERRDSQPANAVAANSVLPTPLADTLPHDSLYSHQATAIAALQDGDDVCITTSTASGKTLIYALHIAYTHITTETSTAFLIYPTKALARDQQQELTSLYDQLGLDIDVGVYDGDVSRDEKDRVRNECDVIITNFVGLNHYLPHHESWGTFFDNLSTLVIDEAHMYTGLEGIHVGWLIRRLLRILRSHEYGTDPQMILTTATIGNPQEHAHALTGRRVTVVDNDGSPQGARDIVLWNPPTYTDNSGDLRRKSSHKESSRVLATLVANGAQSLMFVPSRRMSELCAQWAEDALLKQTPNPSARIEPYHAGHTKRERREIETQLKSGEIDGVVTTSALEVGIDVGSVDATILDGYPGSRMSFWQQLGRSGRGNTHSLTVMVAQNDSIDQYITRNPAYLFEEDVEDAVVDLGNEHIYRKHVVTAAREMPLRGIDRNYFGPRLESTVEELNAEGLLDGTLDTRVFYAQSGRPEASINMYGTSQAQSFDVMIDADDGVISLPPVEQSRAYREFHPNAVYLHKGEQYQVENFKETEQEIWLEPSNKPYRTQSTRQVNITDIAATESHKVADGITAHAGTGTIQEYYRSYDKIYDDGTRESGYSTNLSTPLTLSTDMLWLTFDKERWTDIQAASDGPALGALHAAEHGLIKMAPTELMVESEDFGGLSTLTHSETENPTIFVYDGAHGGLGFSHSMYESLPTVSRATHAMIVHCACDSSDGCPACVMDYMCGDNNEPLDTDGARHLLARIMN